MARALGSRSDARAGRVLSPAFLERRWKPGQSGNPSGQTAEYGEIVTLARTLSVRAIERLGELMESADERVSSGGLHNREAVGIRFELIAERKLRNRQLTDHGNVEINGRDLRALSKAGAEVRVASIGL